MKSRLITFAITTLTLSTIFSVHTAASSTPSAPADTQTVVTQGAANAQQAEYQRLSGELQELLNQLSVKKKELAKLRRKWIAVKGRMPSQEELDEYNEQRAEGAVSFEDNPYVNKNPLSSPGIYRKAYYEKLAEVRSIEAKIASLREEIDDLNQ